MSQHWRLLAACAGSDPNIWETPSHKPGPDRARQVAAARQALAYCAGCPVRQACDSDAQRHRVVGLIRGGKAYDLDGNPSKDCERCGRVIVGRNGKLARFCSDNCRNLTLYHAARQERLAA